MKKKSSGKSGEAKSQSKRSPGSGALRDRPSVRSSPGQTTVKQRRYVAGRVAGKSKRQAAIQAGYAKTTAGNAKQKIDAKPGVQRLFTELLDKAGVTDQLLARRIRQGLNATETKFATFEGEITASEELIAYPERREMVELVLKLKGHLIEKHEFMVRTLEEILEASNE